MKTIKANDGKTYYLPKNPVWRTGFPDKPGWYPTRKSATSLICIEYPYKQVKFVIDMESDVQTLRFFNQVGWSFSARPNFTREHAEVMQSIPSLHSSFHFSKPWWTPEAQAAIKKGEL
jgi:hypothetical protein